jgi:meso-butanediol dehydrogenase / (S,S)-butanediol dehydrogenase / diacetyl reductase
MSATFLDKVVFVTGAASGLGKATALAFARDGASLALMDLNGSGLADTRHSVEQLDRPCITFTADVALRANCQSAVAETVAHFNRLDVLCNVAGVVAMSPTVDISEADWERTVGSNLSGPFYLSQAAIPHLLQSSGNIINVSSANGLKAGAYIAPYNATKAGLLHLTRSMAMEFINQPIRINAILPGTMNTPMVQNAKLPEGLDMSLLQRFFNVRPNSEASEVADFILYVASDKAKSIHGACLAIDSGLSTD